ncbi:yjeF C-terminal region, hydroxy-ethyl-thiazolekinase-related protein [Faecalicoccus pleomorphus]|uniref:Bifunctional NAD(P)H-hydrate repair enzyme n=1 Tax=Faecalicoccus pleomorphus TaxID=1323 RepID=A0A380LMA7_9FIRM|nr:bifunctional ADP-dependent NAD(P)H-hydrate dehydratase/NAD(P)H-hydrate epimerase [Faecalicoccus pleomorphus]SUO04355.1 yjeF C-terminal region, hydroxy-ethyl-thiazolekinase-related protein [Faecalicoccus pleomorphus]
MKTTICTAAQARLADKTAIHEHKIPSLILMEHAALGCTKIIQKHLQPGGQILILCGPGNNGGDGLAIARLLQRPCFVYAPKASSMSNDERIQWDMLEKNEQVHFSSFEETLSLMQNADMVIDALFGNGLSRNIEGNYKTLIDAVNASNAFVISIDINSGLDATTGKILNACIISDLTICLDCIKTGQLINDGKKVCSKLECLSIGIPQTIHASLKTAILLDSEEAKQLLPRRSNDGHKGTFGKALMIGGSYSMHGAITMAARACYQSGIGTLTCFVPDCIHDILAQKMEFAMLKSGEDKNGYFSNTAIEVLTKETGKYDIVTIGNGMGQQESTKELVQKALQLSTCTLFDADACWAIREHPELLRQDFSIILTPHIKEMTYLCHRSLSEILQDPFGTVQEFCASYPNCTLVLKSDITLIGHKDQMYVLHQPNSALAKGGSGDILCGIIAGLYGQCRNAFQAAAIGTYIHSCCAKQKKDPACFMQRPIRK